MTLHHSPGTPSEHTPERSDSSLLRDIANKRTAAMAAMLVLLGGAAARVAIIQKPETKKGFAFSTPSVGDTDFDEKVLGSQKPVLVSFGAPWCPPCRQLDPKIQDLLERHAQKIEGYHMDVDENTRDDPYIFKSENESPIPRTIVFVNGETRISVMGGSIAAFEELEDSVDKLLSEEKKQKQ